MGLARMATTAPPNTPSKKQVFFTRLFSTLLLWGMLFLAFRLGLEWPFAALAALFGIGSAFEYFRLMKADSGATAFRRMGLILCIVYWAMASWHVLHQGTPQPCWMDLLILVLTVQGAFLLSYRSGLEGAQTLQRIFSTVFGVFYTATLFGFLLRILYFSRGEALPGGLFLMLFVVMVTKFTDAGAYAIGALFGKRKMIPHISPAKSWEGLIGGFSGAWLTAFLLIWLIPEKLAPLNWLHVLWLVPVLCIAGVAGDLAESVLKRCFVIKDSGHALPGIGGILDLTDSLLFTSPIFYFYLLANS
jgi:phosphatidate cytidylyltransferase